MILSSEQVDGLFEGREVRHYEPIRASEETEFGLRPAYRQDGSYPVQLEPAKKATCRAKVTHIRLDGERWELTLKLDTVREEIPRFLQRSGGKPRGRDEEDQTARGYTHRPSVALQDAGEAVDDETLDRFSREARGQHEIRGLKMDAERVVNTIDSIEARARALRLLAKDRDLDVKDDLKVYDGAIERARRRLDAIEEKLRQKRKNAA